MPVKHGKSVLGIFVFVFKIFPKTAESSTLVSQIL